MADDDFGATGGTTDTGLEYAGNMQGYNGDGGAFDMGAEPLGTFAFGEAGDALQQDEDADGGALYSEFPSATGDVNNENIVLSLPSFANEENRALNDKLIARNRELAKAAAETLEHQERISVMQEHLKNVRMELANAQKVLVAKSKEVKSEEHMGTMAERAVGRMRQDLSALDSRGELADQQLSSVHASVLKGTEKLDSFKQAMNWKQEEMEKWAAAARAKDEDLLALDKYTRADEAKVRDLSRELERLAAALIVKRKELEAEALDSAAKQVELDMLAADFRAAHNERAELLQRWQDSLKAITGRDEDIARLTERFADVRLASAARRERLQDSEKLLNRLESENSGMERSIESVNRAVGASRDNLTGWTSRVASTKESVDQLKFEVQGAASELLQKRSENESAEASIEEKRVAFHAAQARLVEMKALRSDAAAQAAAVEKALANKEAYLAGEEARVEKAQKEMATLLESQFRARDTVAKLKETEGNLHGQIAGAKRNRKNLDDRLAELDAQSGKQAEHIYAAEFQIQQMERKIGRARGDVSEEERIRLEARAAELKSELGETQATERQLLAETKTVKQSLQSTIRRQAELAKQLSEVQGTIDEALLQTRSGEEALKRAVREKEEVLVSSDLLKLEVRRLRDALSDKTEGVYAAENRSAQVALSIEARKKEIAAHKAVQRAQGKLAEEERHRLAVELAERAQKVGLLKIKFESLCAKGRSEDGDGEQRSQAYYVLKAAQRREELQREGDELDRLIRQSEKEVRALASTLGYLSDRNEAFRRAFGAAEGGDEVAVVQGLESQAKEAQDLLFRKKRELASLTASMQQSSYRAEEAGSRAAGLAAQLAGLEAQAVRAAGERDAQLALVASKASAVATARAKHRLRRAARGGRAVRADGPSPDEVAFIAQGIREAASSVLFTLGQLARELPALKADLGPLLAERNLRVPARPPSQAAAGSTGGLDTASSLPMGQVRGLAPSPMAVPVAGSALHAVRARPSSGSTTGSAGVAGRVVAQAGPVKQAQGHRAGTPGKAKGGPKENEPQGFDFGVTGRPLASQPTGAGNAPGQSQAGKPPVAGRAGQARAH